MFQNAIATRVEWSVGGELFSGVFMVIEQDDGTFRAVAASGSTTQPHDDSYQEKVFSTHDEALEWLNYSAFPGNL